MELQDISNDISKVIENNIGPDGLPIKEKINITNIEENINNENIVSFVEEDNKIRTKRFATLMNLLNSVLGIGILSVPNSMINSGIIGSLIILIITTYLSYYATKIVISLQLETESEGFDDLANRILGTKGSIILSILSLLFLIVGLISFLIIGGDMIKSYLEIIGYPIQNKQSRAILIFIYSISIPFLLTIPRSVNFLTFFSTATVISVFFYVISMIIKLIITLNSNGIHKTVILFNFNFGMFQTLSIFGLTFSFPVVVLPVIKSYNKLFSKRKTVSGFAIFVCFLIVGISGSSGYLIFGNTCNANIINSFNSNDILFSIVRFGFFIVVSCVYPLVAQVVMCSWSQLIYNINQASNLPTLKRIVILLITNLIPLFIAMFLSSAKPALSVGGALGGCIVNFMYPGLLQIFYSKNPIFHSSNILPIFLTLFGLISGIISTYLAIIDAIVFFKNT